MNEESLKPLCVKRKLLPRISKKSQYLVHNQQSFHSMLVMGVYFFEKSLSFQSPVLCVVF